MSRGSACLASKSIMKKIKANFARRLKKRRKENNLNLGNLPNPYSQINIYTSHHRQVTSPCPCD